MIIDKSGKVYRKMEFSNEAEIEEVVFRNFNFLFNECSVLLEKKRIKTNDGKETIPDGFIIDFENKIWYILEAELGDHGAWEHIIPQITKQITASKNIGTKTKIAEECIEKINKDSSFKDLLDEIGIEEINIYRTINKILEQPPKISLPIDFIPKDLEDWAKDQKIEVNIWIIEKYKDDNEGDILFNIPSIESEIDLENTGGYNEIKTKGDLLTQVIEKGLLLVGQELFFEYGPKGKSKTRFIGTVRRNGIEVDGEISSVTVSSLKCMQKISPERTTAGGWRHWKTKEGKPIKDLLKQL